MSAGTDLPAPLGRLSAGQFLSEFWQRKPCLIRQALPGFQPPLDGDDLAGLACDPGVDARLISGHYPEHDWRVRHGPFDEAVFTALPEERWTLLVRDVEKHYPPLADFMARFRFLPSWRIDDLMISYAATGGSAGPHADRFDVFLLQVEGQRLWQIAERFDAAPVPDCELDVLWRFEPEREWVLKPGDMLYLPPGVAHHGVALDPGMTWSVGLRAPDAAEALEYLGGLLAAGDMPLARYADPDIAANPRAGEIDRGAIERLRAMVREPLARPRAFREFAGSLLTRVRPGHEPAPRKRRLDAASLARLAARGRLRRNPWTRMAWYEHGDEARLFAAGEAFDCSVALAVCLCAQAEPEPFSASLGAADLATLIELVNGGHLLLEED